jgi:acetamidase/formamidase
MKVLDHNRSADGFALGVERFEGTLIAESNPCATLDAYLGRRARGDNVDQNNIRPEVRIYLPVFGPIAALVA